MTTSISSPAGLVRFAARSGRGIFITKEGKNMVSAQPIDVGKKYLPCPPRGCLRCLLGLPNTYTKNQTFQTTDNDFSFIFLIVILLINLRNNHECLNVRRIYCTFALGRKVVSCASLPHSPAISRQAIFGVLHINLTGGNMAPWEITLMFSSLQAEP